MNALYVISNLTLILFGPGIRVGLAPEMRSTFLIGPNNPPSRTTSILRSMSAAVKARPSEYAEVFCGFARRGVATRLTCTCMNCTIYIFKHYECRSKLIDYYRSF